MSVKASLDLLENKSTVHTPKALALCFGPAEPTLEITVSLLPSAWSYCTVENCYFPTNNSCKNTSHPTCSSNVVLILLLGGVYVPSPWICNYGGSNVTWLLGLSHQRWERVSRVACSWKPCWGSPEWPTWRDHLERPGKQFQWTAPGEVPANRLFWICKWRHLQVISGPACPLSHPDFISHPHCALCKFLLLTILEHNKMILLCH